MRLRLRRIVFLKNQLLGVCHLDFFCVSYFLRFGHGMFPPLVTRTSYNNVLV